MVMSDLRSEVEIWPYRARTMKNVQYIWWPNCRYFRVLQEIWVKEDDNDVRFETGSENMAVSCMRNEKYAI